MENIELVQHADLIAPSMVGFDEEVSEAVILF